jgi:hypothetical protein
MASYSFGSDTLEVNTPNHMLVNVHLMKDEAISLNTVLLERLAVTQPVKTFRAIYETKSSITVYTSAYSS